MRLSNNYLQYRGYGNGYRSSQVFVVGGVIAFGEVFLRGSSVVSGECHIEGGWAKQSLQQMLCGAREAPWSNFGDVLSVLTFLAAAVIGVFVADGNNSNTKNDVPARGRALEGLSRADLADEAVEYCALFTAIYLWRTLTLTSLKTLVAIMSLGDSVRDESPDLIIFGALVVGILGCEWVKSALIPKVHVLRLGFEGMERRKWRLEVLKVELEKSMVVDCGVGKHVIPLAGEHPLYVWIIRWLPMARIPLSISFFGILGWVSSGYFEGQSEEMAVWRVLMTAAAFVMVSEFVAALVDKIHHVETCLKCFVESSRVPKWWSLVFGNWLRLGVILFGGLVSCLIMSFDDHEFLFPGVLCLGFVSWHVAVSVLAAMPGAHRQEGLWGASWWTELKEWKERGLGRVSLEQAQCALVLQDYMRAETGGHFKWLRSPVTLVRKSHGPVRNAVKYLKNRIEESRALLADAIEDMGGGKSSTQ